MRTVDKERYKTALTANSQDIVDTENRKSTAKDRERTEIKVTI